MRKESATFSRECNNFSVAYLENVFLQLKEIKIFRLAETARAMET